MKNKRMFSVEVVQTDKFLNMSSTAQNLYFHLGMVADDNGFVAQPFSTMRMIGANNGDMQVLLEYGYVMMFKTGVILITHWKLNNYIRVDRYTPTKCFEELEQVSLNENNIYVLVKKVDELPHGTPHGIPDSTPDGLPKLNKISLDNNNSRETRHTTSKKRVEPSTKVIEVIEYLNKKTGKEFKPTTKETVQKINARLKDGYTVEDMKKVIDEKYENWKNTEFFKYMRPSTLFKQAKFEEYLNQTSNTPEEKEQFKLL